MNEVEEIRREIKILENDLRNPVVYGREEMESALTWFRCRLMRLEREAS